MTFRHSLRARLTLSYIGLIVVGFAGLALLAGRQIEAGAVEDFEHSLVTQASLVARGLTEPIEQFREKELAQSALSQVMAGYAAELNARLLLVDPTGRAWLSSEATLPSGNMRLQPEIAAALDRRITYDTRPGNGGGMVLYVAAPIVEDEHLLSIVSLSLPLSAARSLIVQRWLALGSGMLVLAALAAVVSSFLAASLTRPLAQLRHSALQMASGDLDQRLAENRQDEIGELAVAFNHMAAQVKSMLEEQRAFASNASHELRTPLTAIRLRSEALREGHVDEATARQYIAEIDSEMARLSELVEDLILLSQLDSGRARPGDQQVDVARLLQHLLDEYAARLCVKNLTLTLDMPPDVPPLVASMHHLRIVFRNVLDNAVKYTPAGGAISWQLQVEDGHLHTTIRDTGRGIAPEDLPHLFERFYRADQARSRETPGVGLGLSLVREVIGAYGGRVTIDSPGIDKGTTVDVWWPLPTAAEMGVAVF
jgi:signal transduction histidine kinase